MKIFSFKLCLCITLLGLSVTTTACFTIFLYHRAQAKGHCYSSALHFFTWPCCGTGDQKSLWYRTAHLDIVWGRTLLRAEGEWPRTLMLGLMHIMTMPWDASRKTPCHQPMDPEALTHRSSLVPARPPARCPVLSRRWTEGSKATEAAALHLSLTFSSSICSWEAAYVWYDFSVAPIWIICTQLLALSLWQHSNFFCRHACLPCRSQCFC